MDTDINALVGNDVTSSQPDQSLRKRLNRMFSRYDYVGIQNPLKAPFVWAVALEQNEIVGMSPADQVNEESWSRKEGSTFLPGDSVTRNQQRITKITLQPGEKRMLPGEAAYVIAPRLFNALVREKYGTTKAGLARFRNPTVQGELIQQIVVGPVINNIGQAMQTYVNKEMGKIEGFTDVQTRPKGFRDPEVIAKARATREANKAAKTQGPQSGDPGTQSVSQ